jgi:nucleoside 2-deoxyribosyltransferase
MNRLAYSRAYLAGPIDRVSDRGAFWREDISDFLLQNHIGVLNPSKKPMIGHRDEDDDFVVERTKYKIAGEFDKVHEIMKEVVSTDLRLIDLSDFVILHIDTKVHMCGSYNEQTHACLQRKPVLIHCNTGKVDVPDWLWGICKHEEFFSDWQSLKLYIRDIAYKNRKVHNRWKFVDYAKVYQWKLT